MAISEPQMPVQGTPFTDPVWYLVISELVDAVNDLQDQVTSLQVQVDAEHP